MATIPPAVAARLKQIPTATKRYKTIGPKGVVVFPREVIPDFAIFVDTHRDQPHIGTFFGDIHRGQSRPIKVDYQPDGDLLIEADSGKPLERHDKHLFITEEWFGGWLVGRMLDGESDPRDPDGVMSTSHLRDARNKVYLLKSFRQIVVERLERETLKGGS